MAETDQLHFMDQASFLALRARDQPQLVQWVWVYDRGVDVDGVRRFHDHLGHGLLGRLIERSPLPFGRHRWVAAHRGPGVDVAAARRPRTELGTWADACAQLPIDPESGPGWRLAVVPFTDGSAAVSLVASHCLVDGLGCGLAIADAVKGAALDLGYRPPRSRRRGRALAQDARETVRSLPAVARAVAAAVGMVRRQRDDVARLGASRAASPAGTSGYVAVPAVTLHVAQDDWDARARSLGGTPNSLLIGFMARLGARMGRGGVDDVRVIITASDRAEDDTRANALAFTSIDVEHGRVTTDLSAVRASTRDALRALHESPDEALDLLPLTPFTPKRAVRALGDVLFAFPDLPVTCTNLGDLDPVVARVDGTDADLVFARGVDQRVTPQLLEQKFFVGSGRVGGKVFLTVVAYHLTGPNSKESLAASAVATLAEFDLTATVD